MHTTIIEENYKNKATKAAGLRSSDRCGLTFEETAEGPGRWARRRLWQDYGGFPYRPLLFRRPFVLKINQKIYLLEDKILQFHL
jgi:hypothetical protein